MEAEKIIEKVQQFFEKVGLDDTTCYLIGQRIIKEYEDSVLYEVEENDEEDDIEQPEEDDVPHDDDIDDEEEKPKQKPKNRPRPQKVIRKKPPKEASFDDLDI